jgi:erythronate-4-phosphate dehydrogenase
MHVLADKHIFLIDLLAEAGIPVTFFDSNAGLPDTTDADALLVRTVTQVTGDWTKRNPKVRFIGTASAGFDHLDIQAMERSGIQWASSPGCNAQSVAEFVVASLWHVSGAPFFEEKLRVGIIGVGNAGSAAMRMLMQAGHEVIPYDPPRASREPDFVSASWRDVIDADVLTVHVPLNTETRYLFDERLFKKSRAAVINASRGGVLDERAALRALDEQRIGRLILDVWEGEPLARRESVDAAHVATPHIAGYSFRSKINATRMVTEAMLRFFGEEKAVNWPIPVVKTVDLNGGPFSIHDIHPVTEMTQAFKQVMQLPDAARKASFHALRQTQNERVDWCDLRITGVSASDVQKLGRLGITAIA